MGGGVCQRLRESEELRLGEGWNLWTANHVIQWVDWRKILFTSGFFVELPEQPFQLGAGGRDDGAVGEELGALA